MAVACNGASVNLFAALGSRLGTDFRQRLFNHLLEQPLERRWTPGDEQALLTQQIPTLENVVVVQLPLFIWTVAQILLGVLLLLQTDWRYQPDANGGHEIVNAVLSSQVSIQMTRSR